MSISKLIGSVTLAFVLMGAAQPCLAAAIPLVTINTPAASPRRDATASIGYEFQYTGATGDLVTSLGFLNANGSGLLLENHLVKLFSEAAVNATTGIFLGSVTVPSGTGSAGQFSYVSLTTPISLTNGAWYVVAANVTSGAAGVVDAFLDSSTITVTNGTIPNGRFGGTGPTAFPNNSGSFNYIGPNLLITPVPEPNTFALAGLALVGMLRLTRRHR